MLCGLRVMGQAAFGDGLSLILRGRLLGGIRNKAARGELRGGLNSQAEPKVFSPPLPHPFIEIAR